MSSIIYLSDFMSDEILGGGELNDEELCNQISLTHDIQKIKCSNVTLEDVKDKKLIVSNFVTLNEHLKNFITNNLDYVIYEHDHKYVKNRNPGAYKDFVAPKSEIVNYEFYKKAKAIFCQSSFHKNIVYKNLSLNNIINLSGNIWSSNKLDLIFSLSNEQKTDKFSILKSNNWHKNTQDTVFYCNKKSYDYELIEPNNYSNFLTSLSRNTKFIFLPKTPETLSRVVVEAKMMNVKVVTNKFVGATYEDWYSLSGKELIDFMNIKRQKITNTVLEVLL